MALARHPRGRAEMASLGFTGGGGCPLATLSVLLLLLLLPSAAGEEGPPVKCQKMKEIGLLECQHGGELYSALNASRASCSRCDCPDKSKWHGLDCSLCASVDACPARASDGAAATACTSGAIMKPTAEELAQPRGKVLSCACGGDPQSEQYCAMQPFSYALITMKAVDNASDARDDDNGSDDAGRSADAPLPTFDLQITQYAGAPDVPGEERYTFAYPVIWNATLSQCSHSVGACYGPLAAKECDLISCGTGRVDCPPPNVKKCPDWDPVGDCGFIPGTNETARYWEFHCIPLAIPVNNSGTLYCERSSGATNSSEPPKIIPEAKCYFFQEKSLFGQGTWPLHLAFSLPPFGE